jgi:Putative manganese efflux pump
MLKLILFVIRSDSTRSPCRPRSAPQAFPAETAQRPTSGIVISKPDMTCLDDASAQPSESAADYLAIAVLAGLGGWMLLHEEGEEHERALELIDGRVLATLAIGISISLDELAMGFIIGLLHLNLWIAVALIGA